MCEDIKLKIIAQQDDNTEAGAIVRNEYKRTKLGDAASTRCRCTSEGECVLRGFAPLEGKRSE